MDTLYVYLHTHWDREWYLPFETFRVDLVRVVREILDRLENGELPNFYFDGQSSALEDAVAIDESLSARISKLMEDGRLAAGPWYVLADQTLVGGESLIRNLKLGIELTQKWEKSSSAALRVGYCPDTFGHSQDLPRILKGFGIDCAVVWRGVPQLEGAPHFLWESPDGSRVLTYHLRRGYYQTALNEITVAKELAKWLSTWLNLEKDPSGGADVYDRTLAGALLPAGADHLGPPAQVSTRLKDAEAVLAEQFPGRCQIKTVLLSQFFAELNHAIAKSGASPVVYRGELRDNASAKEFARAYLLDGVLSSRLYLKRANRLAEHRLFAMQEPIQSLLWLTGAASYPHGELGHACKLLLKNQPHDSICGCSIDAVHDEMMSRYHRVHHVLDGLEKTAKDITARCEKTNSLVSFRDPEFPANRVVVFNTSGHEMMAPVRLSWVESIERGKKTRSNNLQVITQVQRDELFSGMGLVPYYKEVNLVDGWVWPGSVPGCGYKEISWPIAGKEIDPPLVTVANRILNNGYLAVEVDRNGELICTVKDTDGSQKIYRPKHSVRDVGDGGDTYNFDPLENDDPIVAKVKSVAVGQRGPLVGSLLVTYELAIKKTTHRISVEISLRRGVPILFFDTQWHNKSSDHRLEVIFNTGDMVSETDAENHYSLIRREHKNSLSKLPVDMGCEALPDRFPCQRFFTSNNQVFFNCGLPEYGIDGSSVTITLLRAVSMLSRGVMRTRGGGAGPHLAVDGANCPGLNRASYGWAALHKDATQNVVYALAEQFEGRLWATLAQRNVPVCSDSLIGLDNQAIKLMSLYVDDGQALIVRLLNVSQDRESLRLSLPGHVDTVERCTLGGDSIKFLVKSSVKSLAETLIVEQGKPCVVKVEFGENELVTLSVRLKANSLMPNLG